MAQSNDFVLAENYFRNGEFEKASLFYQRLSEKSPYNNVYLKRLIACYQELGAFPKAENLLLSKLKQQPNLSFLNVLVGYNFERQQQIEKATEYYNKAINSIDEKPSYAATIAGLFKEYSKLDYAIEAYQKASAGNKNSNYGFQIAQIYGEKGDFDQMFNEYINFLDQNENQLNTVKRFTARYISDDSEDENNILFKKALLRKSASNPKEEWNDLLSWLFTKQKEYSKAFIQEKALYARNADNLAGVNQLGQIAFMNKDYQAAKQCFDFVIDKTSYPRDKFNAIHMNLLIDVETKNPNVEQQFQDLFTEYGINNNTFSIQMAYADFLTFDKNQPKKAKEVLEQALPFATSNYQKGKAKIKLADVLVYQGLYNKALIYYTQVQNQFQNHSLAQEARFKVAQTSYFKNDFKWAKAQLKVLKKSASQLIANDAAELFLTISDNEPKDSLPNGLQQYAKADLLAFQNKNDEAIAILDQVLVDFKGQSIEDEALFKLGKIYTKKKIFNEAISNYEKILTLDKEGIYVDDVLYYMAELYKNELNQPEKASEYYQKIIFEHPSSIYLVDARKKYRKLRGDNI
ncbi:tetratricopeptide repeat protein [Tenacibaculum sp. IB213877]|uniref:tetratricopeptide repeat protein n=1 Tax=Tenacibaculum sp. IB213877 TaxID=3097351 RepID=UPI002A5AFC0C|nr:tetratricopeptide repeat protein [Tenacibaculum sp. IB213877]MDY0780592.1 tetratricopeptide repeat protein [Tenacibaculum sp. IB213877]